MFLLFTPFYIINSVFISKNQISKQKKKIAPIYHRPVQSKPRFINVIKKFYSVWNCESHIC